MKEKQNSLAIILAISTLLLIACGESAIPTRTPRPVAVDLIGNDIKSEFRGPTYSAKVIRGGIILSSTGLPTFDGVVSGTIVLSNQLYEGWVSLDFLSVTNVRILQYDATSNKFLAEGTVEYLDGKELFIAPGTIIENAMTDHGSIMLQGGYELVFGEVVEFDTSGSFRPTNHP